MIFQSLLPIRISLRKDYDIPETSSGISLSFLKKILIGSKLWNIIILSQGNPD
jgi:hypothetical protein